MPPKSKAKKATTVSKGKGAPKKVGGTKRGPSAFLLFSSEKRPGIKKDYPNATFGEIARIVGKLWTELSEEDKEVILFCS